MRLLLSTFRLDEIGGAETYLLTVADHLQRLGHDVTVHAFELGEMADAARDLGLRIARDSELPDSCDGVLAQDGVSACHMARRYPSTPQVFVAHCVHLNRPLPPQLPGVVGAVVALNDRMRHRLEGMACETELVRLRQPVDINRFSPRGKLNEQPRAALLLGNYTRGDLREMIVSACAEQGVAVSQVGAHAERSVHPEVAIAEADIVIGYGRSILEAMSSGRAAYVLDHAGGDGWVTPETYPALEADGFAGSATATIIDGERLRRDLGSFAPEMGAFNRQAACAMHEPLGHAADLVGLLRRLAPARGTPAGVDEVERLTRVQWATEARVLLLEIENEGLRDRLRAEHDGIEQERSEIRAHWDALQSFKRSRRYRFADGMGRAVRAGRRWGGSR